MTRSALALAFVLAGATQIEAQQSAQPLSLNDAIAMAVQQSRTLTSAAIEVQKAETEVSTARSYRYPSFSFSAQASQFLKPIEIVFPRHAFGSFPEEDTAVTTGRRVGVVISAQISQPITQLGRIRLNADIKELGRDIDRAGAREARIALVNSVKQAYYSILQLDASLDATSHVIASLRELERTVQARVTQRVVLRSDAIDVEGRIAQAELRRLTIQNDLDTEKERLNQLIGRDVATAFEATPIEVGVPLAADVDSRATLAIAGRPDVMQADLKLQQAALATRVAQAAYVPDLSIAFNYYSPLRINGAPQNITTLGLQLDWEPFDWGRRKQAVTLRGLEARQAQHALRDVQDRASIEIRSARRRLEEAAAALLVMRIAQDGARERVRVHTAQFQVASTLLADVLDAQSSLVSANTDYEHALLAVWKASADFERALGQD